MAKGIRCLALLLSLCAPPAQAALVGLGNETTRLVVDPARASLLDWQTCLAACARTRNDQHRLALNGANDAGLRWQITSLTAPWRIRSRSERQLTLTGTTETGQRLQLTLKLAGPHLLRLTVEGDGMPTGGRLTVAAPASFDRGTSHGFAASHERVEAVEETPAGWQAVPDDPPSASGGWIGVRNRFWALLARRADAEPWQYEPGQGWTTPLTPGSRFEIYGGPLTPSALAKVDGRFGGLLFRGLWFWLRWLSFGLLALLNGLHAVIGNWGLSVLALSLCVKLLMTPLTDLAERWQRQVNAVQSRLQPVLQAIRREYKGEEQATRILAAHREMGVTPLYTLKSAFGFLIQIPVFIAAYSVLNEAIGLSGEPLWWVPDLARPDHFLPLPVTLPFFGAHLNLMPVLMTAITLLASWQFNDPSLSAALRRRQQRQLYLMAALFFVLFYTVPAGMVLYWTTNNLVQYLKDRLRLLHMQAAPLGQGQEKREP